MSHETHDPKITARTVITGKHVVLTGICDFAGSQRHTVALDAIRASDRKHLSTVTVHKPAGGTVVRLPGVTLPGRGSYSWEAADGSFHSNSVTVD